MQSAESWAQSDAGRYFRGEWTQGFVWFGVGAVLGAVGLAVRGGVFGEAFWPLVVVAGVQVAAGSWLILTSQSRVAKISSWSDERERIGRVLRLFRVLAVVELAVAVGGAIGVVALRQHRWLFAGIAVQSVAMFVLDHFAHRRAKAYAWSFDGASDQRARLHEIMEESGGKKPDTIGPRPGLR